MCTHDRQEYLEEMDNIEYWQCYGCGEIISFYVDQVGAAKMRTNLEQDLFLVKQELDRLLRQQCTLVIQQEDIYCELSKLDRRREMLEQEKAVIETQIETQIELLQGE